jgi:translocator protein
MKATERGPLWPWLAGSLVLVSLVSAAGGRITAGSVKTWYAALLKPEATPPDAAFPIVWSALYVAMAIAAFLVFRSAGSLKAAPAAFLAYGAQLLLNFGWSYLFFGLHDPFTAGIEVMALLGAIALTITLFWTHSRAAALLLLPYLAWVGYAAWLTWRIVALNP